MQTFLPYKSFEASAACLDRRRLGNQRVETLQILDSLLTDNRLRNHPAVTMWEDNVEALIRYGFAICLEWQKRGYRDTVYARLEKRSEDPMERNVAMPRWLGDERLHSSHRSNLLRKDRIYYGRFHWTEDETLPYFWPD